MTETPSSVAASFTGSIPENYDKYLGPLLFEFSAADMTRRVAGAVDGPARILEIACGTGILTRHLARALPEGSKIVATDLNQAMLDHAVRMNTHSQNVTYEQADALELPFEDESYDAVICQYGIMFFPDKTRGMREMARVLRPGSVLALNVWGSFEENPAVAIVDGVIKSFFEVDPPRVLEIPFSMSDEQVLRVLYADAGFSDVDVDRVVGTVEVTDHSVPARGLVTGNPTVLEIEKRAAVDAETIIGAAASALEDAFGPAPVDYSFREIVCIGRKPAT